MPTSSAKLQTSHRAAIPLQLREKGKATSAPPSHNAYTSAYFSRAILGPWGSLVYPWWFGTTRLRFKSGRTHYGPRPRAAYRFGYVNAADRALRWPRRPG